MRKLNDKTASQQADEDERMGESGGGKGKALKSAGHQVIQTARNILRG